MRVLVCLANSDCLIKIACVYQSAINLEDVNIFQFADGTITMSDEKRLIKKLLDNYETVGVVGRPVYNVSQTISVSYGLSLIQILDLDEKNQVLTTNVWSRYVSALVVTETLIEHLYSATPRSELITVAQSAVHMSSCTHSFISFSRYLML